MPAIISHLERESDKAIDAMIRLQSVVGLDKAARDAIRKTSMAFCDALNDMCMGKIEESPEMKALRIIEKFADHVKKGEVEVLEAFGKKLTTHDDALKMAQIRDFVRLVLKLKDENNGSE